MARSSDPDLLISLRRTIVPVIVGFLISQALRVGFDIPADELTGVIEALVTGVYYTAVRIAEQYAPALGMLLGASKQPKY